MAIRRVRLCRQRVAELTDAVADVSRLRLTGLTLRLEDVARFSDQAGTARIALHGHIIMPLPSVAEVCPQDYWLRCSLDGGEFRLNHGDCLHVDALEGELSGLHVVGCGKDGLFSRVVLHGEAMTLRNVWLQGCELHVLGSSARLEECTVSGSGNQPVGICVRRAQAETPIPRCVVLSGCRVNNSCIALDVQHAHGLKVLHCECVSLLEHASVIFGRAWLHRLIDKA